MFVVSSCLDSVSFVSQQDHDFTLAVCFLSHLDLNMKYTLLLKSNLLLGSARMFLELNVMEFCWIIGAFASFVSSSASFVLATRS